jgi:hypothetical protein
MGTHEIHTVRGFEKVDRFTLRVWFEDGTEQLIDFEPVLAGEIFEPLRDPEYFGRVRLDEEIGTLTWPNGADFDPSTLYHWPRYGPALAALAASWSPGRQSRRG